MAAADVLPPPGHGAAFPKELPTIRAIGGKDVNGDLLGWLHPIPADTPVEEMRASYEKHGYIWVKNVIPREDVYDLREHYFRTFQPAGILDPSTSPRDGIFDPTQDPMTHQGIGGWPDVPAFELLERVHASDSYLRFLEHPDLRAFVRKLMGWEKEFLLPRAMLRHNCPGSFSTGMHYDQIFLRKGPPTFLTGWVPIGDCAANGGGLMYLEDSSALGKEIEAEFNQAAQVLTPEERISAFNQHMAKSGCIPQDPGGFAEERAKSSRWLVGNFEAGDIVFHDPYMIHASTNNSDKLGRIRLASDLRFYEAGTDIDERWLKLFTRNDGL